eukprot:TRINITY_DN13524_c0_g1_i1.p1 TRINITY_DN13524_c0_g1~~TRINITY_DN13524_c0_g1_i1.p1  ORF type:complete len:693 (+),score=175.01 TRINITY_DN13524_c0_g1_i1:122-2200(+)
MPTKPYIGAGAAVRKAIVDFEQKHGHKPRPVGERMGMNYSDAAGKMPKQHHAGDPSPVAGAVRSFRALLEVYFVLWVLLRFVLLPLGEAATQLGKMLGAPIDWSVTVPEGSDALYVVAAGLLAGCVAAGGAVGRLLALTLALLSEALVPLPAAVTGGRSAPGTWRRAQDAAAGGASAGLCAAAAVAAVWAFAEPAAALIADGLRQPNAIVNALGAVGADLGNTSWPGSSDVPDWLATALMTGCGVCFIGGAAYAHRLWGTDEGSRRAARSSGPPLTPVGAFFIALGMAGVSGALGALAAKAAAVLGVLALLYRRKFSLKELPSKETFSNADPRFQALRRKLFPPPYPNGWFRLCNSVDIDDGKVKSISALGRHFVAFRGKDGTAGVLHAFCPHIGAHLGGGCVTDAGLQCPFHHWTFDQTGRCTRQPSSRFPEPKGEALQARSQVKAYECREHLGMIFVWFHAEGAPPSWELKYHKDCADTERMYMGAMRQLTMDQHVCEMSENSADYFHFATLHRPMPISGIGRVLTGRHCCHALYPQDRDDGEAHVAFFEEECVTILLMDKWRVPVISGRTGGAAVIFEGPGIVHFEIQAMPGFLGKLRMIKTILPVEPHKIQVETRWFAEWAPPHVVNFLAGIAVGGLEQDREVWETKIFRKEPRLADGDGPYRAYRSWWNTFYSEHSEEMDTVNALEW